MKFFEFHNKARQFTISHLNSQYRGTWLAYRSTLRLYLQKKYTLAIPRFKKLLLQFSDTFMHREIIYRLAMCYYRVSQYKVARKYFKEVLVKKRGICNYIPLTFYRKALCQYYQEENALAIVELANFIRDFPGHYLIPSAYYFLGKLF